MSKSPERPGWGPAHRQNRDAALPRGNCVMALCPGIPDSASETEGRPWSQTIEWSWTRPVQVSDERN